MSVFSSGGSSATFKIRVTDGMMPQWYREALWNRRQIPYANKEDVQFGGLSNWKLSAEVMIYDEASYAALQIMQGTIGGSLTDLYGADYASVALASVGQPKKAMGQPADSPLYILEITLEREG